MRDSLLVSGEGYGKPSVTENSLAGMAKDGCPSGEGILPISQSGFPTGVVLADFPLTGSGEAYANCGSFFTIGCLNGEGHKGMNLDGVLMEGKAYLERHKNSCHRPLCPTCWEDWANREKDKATQRLRAFVLKGRNLKPIHVTVSVPMVDYRLSLPKMREKVYRALKMVHCLGGMMIFHPKRQRQDGSWYFSPHFHVIGYGWIVDVRRNYVASGYIVKNIGIRKTVEGTIFYQLSHCGVSANFHTVTWFGCLGYGKLRVKIEKEEHLCPICGEKLHRLMWVGKGECPVPYLEGVGFFDDLANWVHISRGFFNGE